MRAEQIVEATLFASQTPLTPAEIARADGDLDVPAVLEAIQVLRDDYEGAERAFQVYQLGEGYQILTRPEYAPYLERFDSVPRAPHLSPAALETLAIIAYRQPIGRVEIEEVRGVGASSVLRTLLDWELVRVVGRAEGLGRPLLYGVTQRFLDHFGLKDVSDLPAPDELPVVLGELQQALAAEAAAELDQGAPEAPVPPATESEPDAPGDEPPAGSFEPEEP
jgi:segregation and condensation protein B